MSIFSETFPDFVKNELTNRQQDISSNRNDSLSTIMSSTAWVRMTSGVNVLKKDAVPNAKGIYQPSDYTSDLAKSNVITGVVGGNKTTSNFPLIGYDNKFNKNLNRHGIRPLPGIDSLSCQSYSANGSLRKVTVKFTCWDLSQLDVLELLYMRPGYPLCIEWGWSHMLGDNKVINNYPNFGDDFLKDNQSKSLLELYSDAYNKVKEYKGNIDVAIGKVQNYQYSARPDGGYDCETTIVTYGEILDSLKINYIPFNSDISKKGIFNISPLSSKEQLVNNKYSEGVLAGILQELDAFAKSYKPASVVDATPFLSKNGEEWEDDIKLFSLNIPSDTTKNTQECLSSNNKVQSYIQLAGLFTLMNKYVLVGNKNGGLTKISWYDENKKYFKCASHPFQFSTNPQKCIINPQGWLGSKNESEVQRFQIISPSGITLSPGDEELIQLFWDTRHELNYAVGGQSANKHYESFLKLLENQLPKNGYFIEDALQVVINNILQYRTTIEDNKITPITNTRTGGYTYSYSLDLSQESIYQINYLRFLNILIPDLTDKLKEVYNPYRNIREAILKSISEEDPNISNFTGISKSQLNKYFNSLLNKLYDLPSSITNNFENNSLNSIKQSLTTSGLNNLTGFYDLNSDPTYKTAYLPNIYINLDFLYQLIKPTVTETDDKNNRNEIACNSFLRRILDEIQNSIGSINDFQIYGDYADGTVKIIDKNYIKPISNDIFQFEVDNTSSILTSYSIKSQIFPEQSSIIAISAQAKSGILGYNNQGLIDYNSGLISRLTPSIDSSASNIIPASEEENKKDLYSYTSAIYQLGAFISKTYNVQSNDNSNSINSNASLNNNILRDLISYWDENNDTNIGTYATPIPVILHLEFTGISGIKIGNLFDITGGNKTRILPASFKGINVLDNNIKFNDSNFVFIVRNLSHSVENNVWITKIEGYPFKLPIIVKPNNNSTISNEGVIASAIKSTNLNYNQEVISVLPSSNLINADLAAQYGVIINK
jgi:hypothetical protein